MRLKEEKNKKSKVNTKKKAKINNKAKSNKKVSNSQIKNNNHRNAREIELSSENIRIIKPEKVADIKKNKRAVKQKTAPRKKKKKNVNPKLIKLLKGTSILILVIGITIVICVTPIFNIKNIEVKGNSKITKNEVISLSQIRINDNIFKYSKNKISEAICENPYVKSVKVKKRYPNEVELIVEERKKSACVKILNSFAYIDKEGYILEISQERNELPIIEGILTNEASIQVGKRLVQEDIKNLTTALKIIEICKKREIEEKLYSVNISNDEFILNLETQNKKVYLGDASNLIYRIDAVKEALKNLTDKQGNLFAHGDLNNGFKLYFSEFKPDVNETSEGDVINE